MHDDQVVFVGVEFVEAVRELLEGDQRAAKVGDGVFTLFAHVQDERRLIRIH